MSNQGIQNILYNIRNIGSLTAVVNPTESSNPASNQQEINLQKEISELRTKYENQLREQRHELVQRTRDLQKVERKNIKYRENNRVLSEAV